MQESSETISCCGIIIWFALETCSVKLGVLLSSVSPVLFNKHKECKEVDGFLHVCPLFLKQNSFLFFKHLNYTFQGIGQIKSSFIKDRWMGYIFPPSDRLRHCREAAVTPPQSVTATALPSHSKRAPLLFLFYQTYRQHNSSIYGLFFALLWTPGYSLFFLRLFACACVGACWRDKRKQLPCGCRCRVVILMELDIH